MSSPTHYVYNTLYMRTKTELQICVYIYVVPTVRVPFCKTPLELSIFLIEASFKTGEKLLCIITFKTKTSWNKVCINAAIIQPCTRITSTIHTFLTELCRLLQPLDCCVRCMFTCHHEQKILSSLTWGLFRINKSLGLYPIKSKAIKPK